MATSRPKLDLSCPGTLELETTEDGVLVWHYVHYSLESKIRWVRAHCPRCGDKAARHFSQEVRYSAVVRRHIRGVPIHCGRVWNEKKDE